MQSTIENQELSSLLARLHPQIEKICTISCSPGLSLGVLHQGEIIHRANFGYSDVEARIAPNSDTMYSINSMTKALTAAAIGILVEEGLMRWDTPVKEILPSFGKGRPEIGGAITTVDLLSHRTGIVSPDTYFFQDDNTLLLKKREEVKIYNYANQKGGFRDSYLYNNFGYAIVGLIIEKLSGLEYGSFLKKKIFDPLGLTRTSLEDEVHITNYSRSYSVLDDGSHFPVPAPKVGTGTLLEGAAGVKSSVNDLLALYKAFMTASDAQIQAKTTSTPNSPFKQCATLLKAHSFPDKEPCLRENSYGLGWVRCQLPGVIGKQGINSRLQIDLPVIGSEDKPRMCIYHEGIMPGSLTNVYMFPETMTAVVTLQNAVSLNDTPDWVSQLLIETIFDFSKKNDFLELSQVSAARMMALIPSQMRKLEAKRIPNTNPSHPLEKYCGCYYSAIKNFFVEVTQNGDDQLQLAFQGLKSQRNRLRHYHYDTFCWLMTHNEAAKKARLTVNFPAEYYLLSFGTAFDGSVDRLYWVIENSFPEAEIFFKQ